MDAVVGQVAIGKNSCVSSWASGHLPLMDFFAIVVDHPNDTGAGEVGVEHEARRDFVMIYASKADSSSM